MTRREFLRDATASSVGATLPAIMPIEAAQAMGEASRKAVRGGQPVELMWLGDAPPPAPAEVSWGVPWARGTMPQGRLGEVRTADGRTIPTQNWPLAFWPDGSLELTGLAVAADQHVSGPLTLAVASGPVAHSPMKVWEEVDGVDITTGPMTCRLARSGSALIESLAVEGREVAKNGRLVVIREDRSQLASDRVVRQEDYTSQIKKITVEQSGPVRAVVKIEGMHSAGPGARSWLPFVVRLYFTAGLTSIRVVHSFIFDGDAQTDYIRGLGVAFTVPFREEKQNRHVRFAGEGEGFWVEPVLMSPGYRNGMVKDAAAMNLAQLAGKRIPNLDELGAKEK